MGFLGAILVLIGLAALIWTAASWYSQWRSDRPPEDDLAAPYREGLQAAMRMQVAGEELEQQLYAEEMRQAGNVPGGES